MTLWKCPPSMAMTASSCEESVGHVQRRRAEVIVSLCSSLQSVCLLKDIEVPVWAPRAFRRCQIMLSSKCC